jgi:hypothetical protein
MQSIPPQLISLRFILILSTNIRLGLLSGLFPSGFAINIIYEFLFSPIRATWGRAMLWWQGTHITWIVHYAIIKHRTYSGKWLASVKRDVSRVVWTVLIHVANFHGRGLSHWSHNAIWSCLFRLAVCCAYSLFRLLVLTTEHDLLRPPLRLPRLRLSECKCCSLAHGDRAPLICMMRARACVYTCPSSMTRQWNYKLKKIEI